jgi:WD40 repeat protein
MSNTLKPNQQLKPDEFIISPNNIYKLWMQTDGNLVLYNTSKSFGDPLWGKPLAIWASNTNWAGSHVIMQDNGNLVMFSAAPTSRKLWDSGTGGEHGAYLEIQDDGNLVIYHPRYTLWKTDTKGR